MCTKTYESSRQPIRATLKMRMARLTTLIVVEARQVSKRRIACFSRVYTALLLNTPNTAEHFEKRCSLIPSKRCELSVLVPVQSKKKKTKSIPIPRCRQVRHQIPDVSLGWLERPAQFQLVSFVVKKGMGKWGLPSHYIKYHLSTNANLPHANDFYDLLQADKEWLEKKNKNG